MAQGQNVLSYNKRHSLIKFNLPVIFFKRIPKKIGE